MFNKWVMSQQLSHGRKRLECSKSLFDTSIPSQKSLMKLRVGAMDAVPKSLKLRVEAMRAVPEETLRMEAKSAVQVISRVGEKSDAPEE